MIKFVETVDEIVTTEILRLVLAQVLNDKGGVIVTLKSGDSFGEVALYGALARRTATVVSPTYCDLDVLLKSDFLDLVKEFPDMQVKIQEKVLDMAKGFKEGLSKDQKRMLSRAKDAPLSPKTPSPISLLDGTKDAPAGTEKRKSFSKRRKSIIELIREGPDTGEKDRPDLIEAPPSFQAQHHPQVSNRRGSSADAIKDTLHKLGERLHLPEINIRKGSQGLSKYSHGNGGVAADDNGVSQLKPLSPPQLLPKKLEGPPMPGIIALSSNNKVVPVSVSGPAEGPESNYKKDMRLEIECQNEKNHEAASVGVGLAESWDLLEGAPKESFGLPESSVLQSMDDHFSQLDDDLENRFDNMDGALGEIMAALAVLKNNQGSGSNHGSPGNASNGNAGSEVSVLQARSKDDRIQINANRVTSILQKTDGDRHTAQSLQWEALDTHGRNKVAAAFQKRIDALVKDSDTMTNVLCEHLLQGMDFSHLLLQQTYT